MLPAMHAIARLSVAAILLLAAATSVRAATLATVDIRGVDAPMTANVRDALSLSDALGKDVSGRRLAYLLRQAPAETRAALEPFGYFSPDIAVTRGTTARGAVTVVIRITPGTPVRVRAAHVAVDGPAQADATVRRDLAAFEPSVGDVFDQGVYEGSKARVGADLIAHGYFDADFLSHRVAVTRAANAADIDLVWTSGVRYAMGA